MKLHELLEHKLYEDLQLVRFKYAKAHKDPTPRVKVLDFEYPGREGQKTYGKRKDLLGFNINYFSNGKYAARAIDEIDGFARLLSADKQEKYQRLRYFYPEILKHIRRYKREHISGLKRKGKVFYHPTTYEELIKKDNESW